MPDSQKLPPEVEHFILTRIPSVAFLEGVLLLRACAPSPRSVREVAQPLYIPEAEAERLLLAMTAAGIVVAEGPRFRYQPHPELAAAIDKVEQAYRTQLIGVTKLIHDATRRTAQQFAGAFKLKKDP